MQISEDDVLITMAGDVDFLVTAEFDMVEELEPARGRPVRINMAGVTFFDSRGIAELLTARNFAPRVELVNTPAGRAQTARDHRHHQPVQLPGPGLSAPARLAP